MEKHKCKLCYRTFGNGRALGGHMRSHMLNLYVPPKSDQLSGQLGDEYESTQSFSSSSDDDDDDDDDDVEEEEDKGLLNYKLRENPKKSFRLVDPEFSFSGGGAAVVLQDRESETESFKYHSSIRRRSKRIQKSYPDMEINDDQELFSSKKQKISTTTKQLSCFETEPVSSVSDTTSDEDLAYCLIMMSRDKWRSPERKLNKYISMDYFLNDHQNIDEEEDEEDDDEEDVIKSNKTSTRSKGKYKCETCDRVFKSYQALGGHRASHKKTRAMNVYQQDHNDVNGSSTVAPEEKIHECPVCFRVFASGQALGGHKRSHGIGSTTGIMATSTAAAVTGTTNNNVITNNNSVKFGGETIDLNLPAPVDEDEFSSQVEISAVSDTTEFVHP